LHRRHRRSERHVLCTDGLVERRGSDLDEGTDRLLRLLTENRA
jgi:hypothetical protein